MGKKLKVLITGGSGLLGYLWANARDEYETIILLEHKKKIQSGRWDVESLDEIDQYEFTKLLEKRKIDIVVNTIGLANVAKCQKMPDLAYNINEKLPGKIADACSDYGSKMIHISTDHLYGDSQNLYTENDKVILKNVYADSKFKGELNVLSKNNSALICRTNFFGNGPIGRTSFSDRIIESAHNKEFIDLYEDVQFSPLNGLNVANFAHSLCNLNCNGLYNICSDDHMSKYEFGIELCKHLQLNSNYIRRGSLKGDKNNSQKPSIMTLSNKKATSKLGHNLGSIKDNILLISKDKERFHKNG